MRRTSCDPRRHHSPPHLICILPRHWGLRMSGEPEPSLYFLTLPDLRKLCCITLTLGCDHSCGELRNKQLVACRDLIFQFPDVIASPVLESSEICAIMSIDFFKTGIIQAYTQRCSLKMGGLQQVLPALLQTCLSYTLTARLAPNWNKAGQFLIAGKDFLTDSGKRDAVGKYDMDTPQKYICVAFCVVTLGDGLLPVMELSTWEDQLCISLEGRAVRLPPPTLEEFNIAPNVMKNFNTSEDAVIQAFSMPNNWCYVLPSMKRGQIMSISHQTPPDCPFQSYIHMRQHWRSLYGYELSHVAEEDVVYCSVYFRLVGERLFTYPLSCIRTQPVQLFPRAEQQRALSSFLLDLSNKLQCVCGFPVKLTTQPCYYSASLITPSSQDFSTRPLNVSSGLFSKLPRSCPHVSSPAGLSVYPCAVWDRDTWGGGLTQEHQAALPGITPSVRPSSAVPAGASKLPLPRQVCHHLQGRARVASVSAQQKASHEYGSDERPATHMPQCLPPCLPTAKKDTVSGERHKCRVKRLKTSAGEVDLESYARSSQLSKVPVVALRSWLRARGVVVRSADRKEQLLARVVGCLSERPRKED
ncbi:uncharacterized protein C18orf63 homolog isoform X2 [Arapaima gigas]